MGLHLEFRASYAGEKDIIIVRTIQFVTYTNGDRKWSMDYLIPDARAKV